MLIVESPKAFPQKKKIQKNAGFVLFVGLRNVPCFPLVI